MSRAAFVQWLLRPFMSQLEEDRQAMRELARRSKGGYQGRHRKEDA